MYFILMPLIRLTGKESFKKPKVISGEKKKTGELNTDVGK